TRGSMRRNDLGTQAVQIRTPCAVRHVQPQRRGVVPMKSLSFSTPARRGVRMLKEAVAAGCRPYRWSSVVVHLPALDPLGLLLVPALHGLADRQQGFPCLPRIAPMSLAELDPGPWTR